MDEWPDPQPIEVELPPVDPFPEEFLPEALRPWVRDIAERMQVPIDYPGVASVVALAGALSRRATIQPKARDTGWVVVPNLWGGIIAPPGFMKSPVLQAITRPLLAVEKEWQQEHGKARAQYQNQLAEWEIRHSVWKSEVRENAKGKSGKPKMPGERPHSPTIRRLVANDATFEKLQEMMSGNPAGILLIRDELTGWLAEFERKGREGEREFCLTAWNGDSGYTVDRIGRGTVRVDACCMSVLGGVQPARLQSHLLGTYRDGRYDDGMIQRFQVFVWPDTPTDWNYVDRPPLATAQKQAERIFSRILKLDALKPLRFQFAPDAQGLFVTWLEELEGTIRQRKLPPPIASHLSKYRSLMPSLALIFEMADRAAGSSEGFVGLWPGDTSEVGRIDVEHTLQAYKWCSYLESHAGRVYSLVTPELEAARDLAEKIKEREVAKGDDTFTCREVYLKGWHGLSSPEAVRSAGNILIRAGWIRAVAKEKGSSGGRPSEQYQINPKVRQVQK